MSQITVRQLPEKIEKRLRDLARENQTSLNKTIIALLKKGLGMEEHSGKNRDLADLAGTWNAKHADEFEKII